MTGDGGFSGSGGGGGGGGVGSLKNGLHCPHMYDFSDEAFSTSSSVYMPSHAPCSHL